MVNSVDYLRVADLLEIAAGVLPQVVVRDIGLLASAAARPSTTVFGEDAYPGFNAKAAALMHSLARNDALLDGNKRLAWAATRTFCLLNGRDCRFNTVDESKSFVLAVAAGQLTLTDIVASFEEHLISIPEQSVKPSPKQQARVREVRRPSAKRPNRSQGVER